jgi:hypothetical protein
VNEVFVESGSARSPLQLPAAALVAHQAGGSGSSSDRAWRSIYFGTSIAFVSRDMTGAQVAQLFARGLLCVRRWCAASGRAEDLPGFLMPGAGGKKAGGEGGARLGKRKGLPGPAPA